MTYLRQFQKLPQGFINSTDERVITTGYLDYTSSTSVDFGVGVMTSGTIGDVFKVKVPDNTIGDKFYGIVVHDHTMYRRPGQALFTYNGTDLVPICRKAWDIRVWADTAVTKGDKVYVIHTAATGEVPGHFKNNATGSNATEIQARWIETTSAPGIASLELYLPRKV